MKKRWPRAFGDPIPVPDGRSLATLRDAATTTRWRLSGHQHPKNHLAALAWLAEAGKPVLGPSK
jgi:hypothetical protein